MSLAMPGKAREFFAIIFKKGITSELIESPPPSFVGEVLFFFL